MSATNKAFRVKNGIYSLGGGIFLGQLTAEDPTLEGHLTTKRYVDNLAGSASVFVSSTEPETPTNGNLWFDTLTERLYVYYDEDWSALANLRDAEMLQDHIHDTSIDGSGLIVSVFVSGGTYNEAGYLVSGGFYDTTEFETTWDGGEAIDNFN